MKIKKCLSNDVIGRIYMSNTSRQAPGLSLPRAGSESDSAVGRREYFFNIHSRFHQPPECLRLGRFSSIRVLASVCICK